MDFPSSLITNGRKTLSKKKIHQKHYMYARHLSGYDWYEGEEFPDYSKIKVDQSFNWSAFSIPIWTRFKEKKYHLKIQIDFFEPVLAPALRQKLFYRGQFGLTPVKNILHPLSCGHKMPLDLHFMS